MWNAQVSSGSSLLSPSSASSSSAESLTTRQQQDPESASTNASATILPRHTESQPNRKTLLPRNASDPFAKACFPFLSSTCTNAAYCVLSILQALFLMNVFDATSPLVAAVAPFTSYGTAAVEVESGPLTEKPSLIMDKLPEEVALSELRVRHMAEQEKMRISSVVGGGSFSRNDRKQKSEEDIMPSEAVSTERIGSRQDLVVFPRKARHVKRKLPSKAKLADHQKVKKLEDASKATEDEKQDSTRKPVDMPPKPLLNDVDVPREISVQRTTSQSSSVPEGMPSTATNSREESSLPEQGLTEGRKEEKQRTELSTNSTIDVNAGQGETSSSSPENDKLAGRVASEEPEEVKSVDTEVTREAASQQVDAQEKSTANKPGQAQGTSISATMLGSESSEKESKAAQEQSAETNAEAGDERQEKKGVVSENTSSGTDPRSGSKPQPESQTESGHADHATQKSNGDKLAAGAAEKATHSSNAFDWFAGASVEGQKSSAEVVIRENQLPDVGKGYDWWAGSKPVSTAA